MALFPAFLKLSGRLCLVVGGGRVAEQKIASLLSAEARVRVTALEVSPGIAAWVRERRVEWRARTFEAVDLEDAFLVVAATPLETVNDQVYRLASERRVLCNSVDDPGRCDFFAGAVVRRGALQLAISTGGLSPALAQRLRQRLEKDLGPEYGPWLDRLGEQRAEILAGQGDREEKRRRLHALASEEGLEAFLQETARHPPGERAF
jgi:precorrin-2 dehydrogenase/sirohydrochlorin ferrochelatase